MLFFLYGLDSYRLRQKADHLITQYQTKHLGLSLADFDLERPGELSRLEDFCASQSLFETVKLSLVTNPFIAPVSALKKILLSLVTARATHLIILSDKKPPASLGFLLQNPVHREAFPLLSGPALSAFIASASAQRGLSLSPAASRYLVDSYQDTWQLINELDRLASSDKYILSTSGPRPDFFALINLLTHPLLARRLTALYLLKSRTPDPAKIFNLMAYQRSLNRSLAAAADRDVKSGRLDYSEAILSLILK